ncbi:SRPBCC family protein [Citreimonas salinaria]|uniref:Uncharacterized membrane protein n=1 Tax=Citreimonas salinaria TaxID=321339 RepID=A0A1H3LUU2_9RHOB|nr:SRPBCC family protein [Citreimonas salinaria]SDY68172.1 Uncharacterized membrane protein [Citreimonas salinaria]
MRHDSGRHRGDRLGLLAAATVGVVGLAFLYQQQTRNSVPQRRGDSAPGRAARRARFGRYAVVGRTVTIARPRSEIYAFWRDFSNLSSFMENVRRVEETGEVTHWTIAGPMGRDVHVESRIVADRPDSEIAWRSTGNSEIDTEGKIMFRDAPGDRGTEVEAIIAYVPPMGELGRWVAKAFQTEPHLQGRRDLKRLKMLMETGEIATSALRKTPS